MGDIIIRKQLLIAGDVPTFCLTSWLKAFRCLRFGREWGCRIRYLVVMYRSLANVGVFFDARLYRGVSDYTGVCGCCCCGFLLDDTPIHKYTGVSCFKAWYMGLVYSATRTIPR
jgi:hypothetical protein